MADFSKNKVRTLKITVYNFHIPFLIVSEYHLFIRFLQKKNISWTKLWNFDLFCSH